MTCLITIVERDYCLTSLENQSQKLPCGYVDIFSRETSQRSPGDTFIVLPSPLLGGMVALECWNPSCFGHTPLLPPTLKIKLNLKGG
jgi:hypothetical protein